MFYGKTSRETNETKVVVKIGKNMTLVVNCKVLSQLISFAKHHKVLSNVTKRCQISQKSQRFVEPHKGLSNLTKFCQTSQRFIKPHKALSNLSKLC